MEKIMATATKASSKTNGNAAAKNVKGALVPNLGLDEKARQQVVDLLNHRLSDAFVLYVKTLNYHWNITGPEFIAIHLLLDDQYHELAESIDEIAERVRKVGGVA